MKKNGVLILAVVAIAAGIYFAMRGKTASASKVGSTGTAQYPADTFWNSILNRGTAIAGQKVNGAIQRSGGSGDYSGAATAGINALGNLAKSFFDKLFAGSTAPKNSAPGTSEGFGGGERSETPYFSTMNDYRNAQDFQDMNDLFDSSTPVPQRWNNESDLPLDDAYDAATADDFYTFGA